MLLYNTSLACLLMSLWILLSIKPLKLRTMLFIFRLSTKNGKLETLPSKTEGSQTRKL